MSKRYELSDAKWKMVADLFTAHWRTGRPRVDDRLMLNGVLWVLCSGATWRDTCIRSANSLLGSTALVNSVGRRVASSNQCSATSSCMKR